jgi:hypothetical protein
MRSDWKKVVVERPRWGSSTPNKKFGARLRFIPDHDYEEQPKRVPLSESYRGFQKSFTDVLGPLERLLHRNVGRPWNKVHSELCSVLDGRKVTGRHILDHLDGMVARNGVFERDGIIARIFGREEPVRGFYVHPRTGLLCFAPRESHRELKRKKLLAEPVTRLYLGNNEAYQQYNEIWYRVKLEKIIVNWRDKPKSVWDIFLKKETYVMPSWGVHWHAVEKKQCNRHELAEIRSLLEQREKRVRKI